MHFAAHRFPHDRPEADRVGAGQGRERRGGQLLGRLSHTTIRNGKRGKVGEKRRAGSGGWAALRVAPYSPRIVLTFATSSSGANGFWMNAASSGSRLRARTSSPV